MITLSLFDPPLLMVNVVLFFIHWFPAFSIQAGFALIRRCYVSVSIHFQLRISGKSWPCLSM